ncbi:hypothetical protein JDV02_010688 [Purpureocillium takamizusanense]|uniref:Transcriptional activator of proteases prtT n=1 Tax=Purpureocillium takamizusanense TaxID=2060973 RepID=A0A9Q8QSH3_9HYPO|nr:uncharacterized protein JDV02_010688 [Purpureocillium takamizusanense]UNI24975.1 hypothetical protein JDV02_010688 [Purpureocillium takamizusanense]
MPPLRSARASKACDLCHKYKTRCYVPQVSGGTCLRCETLSQPCSLQRSPHIRPIYEPHSDLRSPAAARNDGSVSERLARLETAMQTVVQRLDANFGRLTLTNTPSAESPERNRAPVLLIRDAAADAGLTTSQSHDDGIEVSEPDIIASGLMTATMANSLIQMFHEHYGRWVRFSQDLPTVMLQLQTKRARLLLYSVLLIAVRHITQDLADHLAPKLFQEVMKLLQKAMLVADQPIEFFQAVVILSLWSSTIGQRPLSIDSWLLTSHAFMQATASPTFARILQPSYKRASSQEGDLDVIYLWNHLCVAHLQYCVVLQRQSFLNQAQIDQCLRMAEGDDATNYEARMVAEVQLYWFIYQESCNSQPVTTGANTMLQTWKQRWSALFGQQRSQFLQMGFYFGQLLTSHQALCSTSTSSKSSILAEMVYLSKTIINLAIETADERTRHLTDHIYHILTFSALTLTQILHTYDSNLQMAGHDVVALDRLVIKLASWLKSIGLRCHISYMFSQTLTMKLKKLRSCSGPHGMAADTGLRESAMAIPSVEDETESDIAFPFPDFIDSELLGLVTNTDSWPQWDSN